MKNVFNLKPTAVFPSELAGTVMALGAGLNALLESSHHVQKTLFAGGRWDVGKNIDLKLQFDRTRIGAQSTGTRTNIQPGFRSTDTVNIFSATVDFVF